MNIPFLSREDVDAVEALAASVYKKTAFGDIPSKIVLAGRDVVVRSVLPMDHNTSQALGDTELRAEYSPRAQCIQIRCAGVTIPKNSIAFEHVVGVLGHEATHFVQREYFTEEQIDSAVLFSRTANASPDDYARYVSSDVELPAHAAMIALALRQTEHSRFRELAKFTEIYRYISRRLDGASNARPVLNALIHEAEKAYSVIQCSS